MANKKSEVIKVFRDIREGKRACLINKNNDERNKAEKKVYDEIKKKTDPLHKQIQALQKKINDVSKAKNEELAAIRKKYDTYNNGCPDGLPVELRKYDMETNKRILDYLNGVTQTLTTE